MPNLDGYQSVAVFKHIVKTFLDVSDAKGDTQRALDHHGIFDLIDLLSIPIEVVDRFTFEGPASLPQPLATECKELIKMFKSWSRKLVIDNDNNLLSEAQWMELSADDFDQFCEASFTWIRPPTPNARTCECLAVAEAPTVPDAGIIELVNIENLERETLHKHLQSNISSYSTVNDSRVLVSTDQGKSSVCESKEVYETGPAYRKDKVVVHPVTRKETACGCQEISGIIVNESTMKVGSRSQEASADLTIPWQEQLQLPVVMMLMALPFVSRVKKKNLVEESNKNILTTRLINSRVKIVSFELPDRQCLDSTPCFIGISIQQLTKHIPGFERDQNGSSLTAMSSGTTQRDVDLKKILLLVDNQTDESLSDDACMRDATLLLFSPGHLRCDQAFVRNKQTNERAIDIAATEIRKIVDHVNGNFLHDDERLNKQAKAMQTSTTPLQQELELVRGRSLSTTTPGVASLSDLIGKSADQQRSSIKFNVELLLCITEPLFSPHRGDIDPILTCVHDRRLKSDAVAVFPHRKAASKFKEASETDDVVGLIKIIDFDLSTVFHFLVDRQFFDVWNRSQVDVARAFDLCEVSNIARDLAGPDGKVIGSRVQIFICFNEKMCAGLEQGNLLLRKLVKHYFAQAEHAKHLTDYADRSTAARLNGDLVVKRNIMMKPPWLPREYEYFINSHFSSTDRTIDSALDAHIDIGVSSKGNKEQADVGNGAAIHHQTISLREPKVLLGFLHGKSILLAEDPCFFSTNQQVSSYNETMISADIASLFSMNATSGLVRGVYHRLIKEKADCFYMSASGIFKHAAGGPPTAIITHPFDSEEYDDWPDVLPVTPITKCNIPLVVGNYKHILEEQLKAQIKIIKLRKIELHHEHAKTAEQTVKLINNLVIQHSTDITDLTQCSLFNVCDILINIVFLSIVWIFLPANTKNFRRSFSFEAGKGSFVSTVAQSHKNHGSRSTVRQSIRTGIETVARATAPVIVIGYLADAKIAIGAAASTISNAQAKGEPSRFPTLISSKPSRFPTLISSKSDEHLLNLHTVEKFLKSNVEITHPPVQASITSLCLVSVQEATNLDDKKGSNDLLWYDARTIESKKIQVFDAFKYLGRGASSAHTENHQESSVNFTDPAVHCPIEDVFTWYMSSPLFAWPLVLFCSIKDCHVVLRTKRRGVTRSKQDCTGHECQYLMTSCNVTSLLERRSRFYKLHLYWSTATIILEHRDLFYGLIMVGAQEPFYWLVYIGLGSRYISRMGELFAVSVGGTERIRVHIQLCHEYLNTAKVTEVLEYVSPGTFVTRLIGYKISTQSVV